MKILFLHGWQSIPGGVKPTYLNDHGHEVINPKLDDDDFEAALITAQQEFDKHHPEVVVGSSRGGAVAMNINSGDAKLVLLCPAWKRWGTAKTAKAGTVILHSRKDDVIAFADSEELERNSGVRLIEVGNDHRLADLEPLEAMLRACEEVDRISEIRKELVDLRSLCADDSRSVLPVFGIQNGKPVLDRTGVLLAIADQGFLLTAAHGLKDIINAEIPLFILPPRKHRGGIELLGEIFGTDKKYIDVASFKLTPETKSALENDGARFLRMRDLDNSATAIPGLYWVRGFPHECEADPMNFATGLYEGDPPDDIRYPYDSDVHLLLDHSENLFGFDQRESRSPKIEGMSGGGIWRVSTNTSSVSSECLPSERKLVAIQTKCLYGRYLKGTWVRFALQLIFEKCPELQKVMESSKWFS